MGNQKLIIAGLVVVAAGAGYYFYSNQQPAEEPAAVEEVVVDATEPEAVEIEIPAPADVAAIPADATLTPEGVGIRVLTPGDGENFPTLQDDVVVWYTGWTTDGAMFDSSHTRGAPDTFPLGRLIAGWQSAVPYLSKGEKALIWIPGDLAYDLRPDRPTAPKGMLVFEIELVDFMPSAPEGE